MIRHGNVILVVFFIAIALSLGEDPRSATLSSSWSWGPGCNKCAHYRCPGDLTRCSLGVVPDPCGCCNDGLCARLPGESCWNHTLVELADERRNDGFCARNYRCQLRSDLRVEDDPEAICVCFEQGYACGNDNLTYSTTCELSDTVHRAKNSSLSLLHLGPCPKRPEIQPPKRIVITESVGHMVSVNCDVKGFPLPDISWRYRSNDGRIFIELPGSEHDAVINSIDGPADPLRRNSVLYLSRVEKRHRGSYECIARNPSGEDALEAYLDVVD